jgi:glycosyltransferase involved in cell wall biosynthesis
MQKTIAILENNIVSTNTMRNKLTLELMSQGFNVFVLTTGTEEDIAIAKKNGINVIDVKTSNINPFHVFRYISNIRKALKKIKADVCLTFTMRPAIWGNYVTGQLGIPTITNITGIGPLFSSHNPAYLLARFLYKFVLRKTAQLFFQNRDDMNLFVIHRFVSSDKAALIPGSGVDHEFFKPQPRINNKKFTFLFIGRLLKDKGVIEYVEAARMIQKENVDVEFKIVGPTWQQNLRKNTITEEHINGWVAENIIIYCGASDDVRSHIAACDCVVLPSYREGISNVLLEASSMEKPCITCDTTGCREIVEHGVTGFLCNVADAVDLSVKMKQMILLSTTQRNDMGINARKKVVKEFDKQFVIDAYLSVINKTIK